MITPDPIAAYFAGLLSGFGISIVAYTIGHRTTEKAASLDHRCNRCKCYWGYDRDMRLVKSAQDRDALMYPHEICPECLPKEVSDCNVGGTPWEPKAPAEFPADGSFKHGRPFPRVMIRSDSVSISLMKDSGMETGTVLAMLDGIYTTCGEVNDYWFIPWIFSSVRVPKAACEIVDEK